MTIKKDISPEETIRIIQTIGYRRAVEILHGYTLFRKSDDVLEFGISPDGQAEITFIRQTDGQISSNQGEFNIWQTSRLPYNAFAAVWQQMKSVAEKSINDALGETLLGYVTPESKNQYPYSPRPIYSERWNKTVEDAISSTAQGARASLGIGYASQQQTALSMNTIFCKFLDAETLKVTKRLAGKTANILHYNLVIQYREILEQAYRIEPNAVPYWLNNQTMNASKTIGKLQGPEEIIDAVRGQFEEQGLWEQFRQLSPRTVTECHPNSSRYHEALQLCKEIGIIPPYTINKPLVQHGISQSNRVRDITTESFRLSVLPRKQRSMTLKDLQKQAQEMTRAYNYGIAAREVPVEVNPIVYQDDGRMDWEATYADLSSQKAKANAQASSNQAEEDSQPKTRAQKLGLTIKPTPTETPRRASKKSREILEKIVKENAYLVTQHLQNNITIDHRPGQHLTISTTLSSEPTVEITKHPDGTIRAYGEYALTGRPEIDDPAANYDSRGIGTMTLAQAIADIAQETWPASSHKAQPVPPPPQRGDVIRWLDTLTPMLEKEALHITDERRLTEIIKNAMRGMLDPEIIWISHRINLYEKVGIDEYNIVARNRHAIEPITVTNRNAAVLYSQYQSTTDEPAKHPGQIISHVREKLQTTGFDLTLWKRLMKADTQVLMAALNYEATSQNKHTMSITMLAQTGASPHPSIWGKVPTMLGREPVSHNIRKITELMLHESERRVTQGDDYNEQEINDEYQDIRDYANTMTHEGVVIQSKNWKNLLERSNQWHRINGHGGYNSIFHSIVRENDNHYREWPSALHQVSIGDVEARSLHSDLALHEETSRMKHCVTSYGNYCKEGDTRIFAIEREEQPIATAEIRLNGRHWEAVQVRGIHNQTAGQATFTTAILLANHYTEAWAAMQRSEHDTYRMVPAP